MNSCLFNLHLTIDLDSKTLFQGRTERNTDCLLHVYVNHKKKTYKKCVINDNVFYVIYRL